MVNWKNLIKQLLAKIKKVFLIKLHKVGGFLFIMLFFTNNKR